MLMQMRQIVDKMWNVAEQLEEKGVGKLIPFIPEDSDIRHAMKAEVIFIMLDIAGAESDPNDDQIAYLRYVLHAPIKQDNKLDFLKAIQSLKMIRFNPLLPYLIFIDRQVESNLAQLYLEFQATLVIGYLKCSSEVNTDMMLRYTSVMMGNKELIEIGYEKELLYDPLASIDNEKKEELLSIYKLNQKTSEEESFEEVKKNMKKIINGENTSSADAKEYADFKEKIMDSHIDLDEQREANNEKDDTVVSCEDNTRTSEELQNELDSMIGLEEVKAQISSMFNVVQIRQMCKDRGIERQPMSYHMVFSGNPGTGKTSVARLIAEIYHSMGLLSKGQLVEVSRADLVAGYVGHTALKVQEVLHKAKGGVLFIDEAYSLTSHSGNDFGHEAVETLIKGMEDNRDDLIVIVAGYPTLMKEFMSSNPGLDSRFSKTIYFPDYDAEELTGIFKKFCNDNHIKINRNVTEIVQHYFEMETTHKTKNFGNARMVRNYFEQCMINQANRLIQKDSVSDAMLCNLTIDDVPKKIIIDNMNFFKV